MNIDVDKLKSVKESFKHWRTTRTKQGKIPDYLWEQVKGLLGDYSLAKICTALNISQTQIKEKLMPKDGIDIQFVEVKEPLPTLALQSQNDPSDTCAVELHRPCGSIFKVTAMPLVLVSQIIVDFMG